MTDVDRFSMLYMRTNSGVKFYHENPQPKDICIEDIAHHLSKLCRFVGGVDGEDTIYSVAEHSVRVSYVNQSEFALWKLLHDAAEAYYNDLARPLKHADGMQGYRHYESLGMKAVCRKFGLTELEPLEVKRADRILAVTEKRDLFRVDNRADIEYDAQPLTEKIIPWTPREAKTRFLMRFYELTGVNKFYEERG